MNLPEFELKLENSRINPSIIKEFDDLFIKKELEVLIIKKRISDLLEKE